MEILIKGRTRLTGEINLSSAKNAILPIIAASLLSDESIILENVPEIRDVYIISELIKDLGKKVEREEDTLHITGESIHNYPTFELVRQIRASFLLMGPLLARRGKARLSLPGGCAIGNRPIDLHLKGFHALGAQINLNGGDIIAESKNLKGSHIYLDFPSVGATENIMMAASLAEGITYIENSALEPEIVDLANFINRMGGIVSGAGTNVIKIEGVKKMQSTHYAPIPDRIEAGTYMVAAAATGGNVVVKNVIPEHLKAVISKLIESGTTVIERENEIQIIGNDIIKPVYIKTLPYPGFPTDMQAQFMAYLSRAEGSSVISESVFENRFMHVPELLRMGAIIKTEGRTAIIKGTDNLTAARVKASDLRAGAALVIAALCAEGESILTNGEHVERGYENFIEKLKKIGANIKRI